MQDILRYSANLLNFFGNYREEVHVQRILLNVLQHKYGEEEMRDDIILTLCFLGNSLGMAGMLEEARSKLEQSLQMSRVVTRTMVHIG